MAAVLEPVVGKVHAPGLSRCGEFDGWRLSDFETATHLSRKPQTLGLPDAVHRLEIHTGQERVDTPKPVSRMSSSELQDLIPKPWIALLGLMTAAGPGEPGIPAGADSRDASLQEMGNHPLARSEAHHFPLAISF